MGSGVHVSHLLFLDFSLFSPLILAHFVSCIKYVMCFLKSNPRVVTSKVFAPVRSYKIVIVVILLETVKGSTAWHPFSKIALQIKTKSLQKTWTRVIPLLLFHKLIISDTKYRCQWHFFSLMSCTPPPKNHAHKRTLWWHDRDCLAQQYQEKKKQLTDVLQKYKHQSLQLKSQHENPQLRINSSIFIKILWTQVCPAEHPTKRCAL